MLSKEPRSCENPSLRVSPERARTRFVASGTSTEISAGEGPAKSTSAQKKKTAFASRFKLIVEIRCWNERPARPPGLPPMVAHRVGGGGKDLMGFVGWAAAPHHVFRNRKSNSHATARMAVWKALIRSAFTCRRQGRAHRI